MMDGYGEHLNPLSETSSFMMKYLYPAIPFLSHTVSLESDNPTTSKIQPVAYPSIPIHLFLFLLFTPALCFVRKQSGL